MDYTLLQQWISKCVKKKKRRRRKKAGNGLLHSPSRSRGHSSCRRHSVLLCFPSCFGPALTFFLPSLPPLSNSPNHPPSSASCTLCQFCTPSSTFMNLSICPAAGQPNRVTRNTASNSIPYLKEDNTRRPDFNNASAAVKPLRLHGQ